MPRITESAKWLKDLSDSTVIEISEDEDEDAQVTIYCQGLIKFCAKF